LVFAWARGELKVVKEGFVSAHVTNSLLTNFFLGVASFLYTQLHGFTGVGVQVPVQPPGLPVESARPPRPVGR